MVRLKGKRQQDKKNGFLLFQFHYGAIKSTFGEFCQMNTFKFQFHYGAIKSVLYLCSVKCLCSISIPLWCD